MSRRPTGPEYRELAHLSKVVDQVLHKTTVLPQTDRKGRVRLTDVDLEWWREPLRLALASLDETLPKLHIWDGTERCLDDVDPHSWYDSMDDFVRGLERCKWCLAVRLAPAGEIPGVKRTLELVSDEGWPKGVGLSFKIVSEPEKVE